MFILQQMARAVWKERIALFWPIWMTIAVVGVVCVICLIRRAGPSKPTGDEEDSGRLLSEFRSGSPLGAVLALSLLALILVWYGLLAFKWEDFAGYDGSIFTLHSLRGIDYRPPIWPENGRFFPLGQQEFNLVGHFTRTPAGYHVLPFVQLCLLCCVLVAVDSGLRITHRAFLVTAVLLTPAIGICVIGLIYPERNVVFFLGCLLLCVRQFERTHSSAWAIGAVLCAHTMIYFKEPAFTVLLVFAVARLAFRCRSTNRKSWDWNQLRTPESALDLSFVLLAVLFIFYYGAAMLPRPNIQYATRFRLPETEVILAYAKLDLLAWALGAVVVARAYWILKGRTAPSVLWDSLALGGLAYFSAYLYLRIVGFYYLFPVDFIAVLYLGRLVSRSWANMTPWRKLAASAALVAVIVHGVALSTVRIFERKNTIQAKVRIARLVCARLRSSPGRTAQLFFPFATPYVVMEFGAYLSYKDVPVQRMDSDGSRGVVLVARTVTKEGRCMPYADLACRPGTAPHPGDLVIIMPDDDASLTKTAPYQSEGELLLSYEPRPETPGWLNPVVRRLHVASALFGRKQFPDRWLHASVTDWNGATSVGPSLQPAVMMNKATVR